jgi:pimeloyl-[acyl-carrier protein] methyl ester esterase
VRHLLKDITAPVLIIHGRHDRICPPETADFLAKRLKKAKVKIINRTGHAPFLTMPKKVNALIEDFIS